MARRDRYRNLGALAAVLVVLGAMVLVPIVVAPRIAQTGSHEPKWAQAVDLAPAAYDGKCQVDPYGADMLHLRGTDYTQPYLGDTGTHSKDAVPVPCHNLSITTVDESGKLSVRIEQWTGEHSAKSNKLEFAMMPQPDGTYELTWGPAAGVTVEWLHATIDDADGNVKLIRGSARHYTWRPHDGVKFPHFILNANDPTALSGHISSLMGPPMPMP